jgi:putative transposase
VVGQHFSNSVRSGCTLGWLSEQYPYVTLYEYVLMPNHLHGIIVIHEHGRGGSRTAPKEALIKPKPLGGLIGAFKTVSTKRVNHLFTVMNHLDK